MKFKQKRLVQFARLRYRRRMKRLLALTLVITCATAGAEIFRRIGPDGEVYFSDTPGPDAGRMDVGLAQTIRMPAVTRRNADAESIARVGAEAQKATTAAYAQFTVVKPSNDQGVRANDGSVTIYLSLQPALMPGHSIELKVDGEDGEKIGSGDTLNFNLTNMSRGRHTVAARVVDEQGKELIKTGPVSFYVLRVALGGRVRIGR